MSVARSRRFERPGQPDLRWRIDAPPGEPRGGILLTHGYGEHSGRYREVVEGWTAHGFVVVSYDLRGHGESGGDRGYIDSFREYVRDAEDLLEAARAEVTWPGKPVLFGHSLGGLISTHVALSRQRRYAGLAMTSPFYGLALEVHPVKVALGRVMSRVAPGFSQPAGLAGDVLTHDTEIARAYDEDPLGLKHVTSRWFTEVAAAQAHVLENSAYLEVPTFCLAAGDDRLVSTETTQQVFDRIPAEDKTLRVIPGLFHELLNELERKDFIEELAQKMASWVPTA